MTNTAQDWIDEQGINVTSVFVPQSRSRNAGQDPCLNWLVTISKGNYEFSIDYQQGVGYVPGYNYHDRSIGQKKAITEVCETGQPAVIDGKRFGGTRPLKPPCVLDVLQCLLTDADVLNYPCFEDWAEMYGYDTDSRTAEKIYQECLGIALKLRSMINLHEMAAAFEDYY